MPANVSWGGSMWQKIIATLSVNADARDQALQYGGVGAPATTGIPGQFYFRTDTPSVVGQRIYQCQADGTWTALNV